MPQDTILSYIIMDERNSNPELANKIRQALALQGYEEKALGSSELIIILSLGDESSLLKLANGREVNVMTWLRWIAKGLLNGGYAILYLLSNISDDQANLLINGHHDDLDDYVRELQNAKKQLLHSFSDMATLLEAINKLPPDCDVGII